jgi:hypothetical protein
MHTAIARADEAGGRSQKRVQPFPTEANNRPSER